MKHLKETKIKISEALKGKIRTKEHCENLSKALKGRKNNWGEKISEAHKRSGLKPPSPRGRIWKEESKKKCSFKMLGERNPAWRGGISPEPYIADWTETLKRSIRERDNYICQLCGKTQIEELENIERKLAIHHIDYNKKNCNPINLIALCQSCHQKTSHNRNYWKDYLCQLIQNKRGHQSN